MRIATSLVLAPLLVSSLANARPTKKAVVVEEDPYAILSEFEPPEGAADYRTWLAAQSKTDQRRIQRFCESEPVNYSPLCGGIGPLHIPRPPIPRDMLPRRVSTEETGDRHEAPQQTRAEWLASLSSAQRAYVKRKCQNLRKYAESSAELCGVIMTPLVISYDDQPVTFASGRTTFAFTAGQPVATDWPTATTPWLARDRDGDGAIDRGAELFGSSTVLADGTTATNGFVALAELDANHDGRIDAADPGFASLVLWSDRDGNGRSAPGELAPAATRLVSIALAYSVNERCDARGNCERERARIVWRDARGTHAGTVVDVYLPER